MSLRGKRILAYFIDVLFLTFLISAICEIRVLNPHYEELYTYNQEYLKLVDDIDNDNVLDLIKNEEFINLSYNIDRYSISNSVVTIVVYLAYFVGFQKWNKDQTLGKKLLKINVKSTNGKSVSWLSYILRTVAAFNVLFTVIGIVLVLTLNQSTYIVANEIIAGLSAVIELITIFMILFRSDNRGLHDLLAKTEVREIENVIN